MKISRIILMTLLMTTAVVTASAKRIQAPQMYIFGFSASFQDSTIYITDIQDVKGAWIDTKGKFLLGRDNYSAQLKDYCTTTLKRPNRVCLVFFDTKLKKAQKKMEKVKKKYITNAKGTYNVIFLKEQDFKFEAIDMSAE